MVVRSLIRKSWFWEKDARAVAHGNIPTLDGEYNIKQ